MLEKFEDSKIENIGMIRAGERMGDLSQETDVE